MALRFRRSIRLLPGVHLNVSKSGVSWSFGRSGATVNVGKDGITRTVGIPGTGISDRTRIASAESSPASSPSPASSSSAEGLLLGFILIVLILAIAALIYGSWTDPAGRTVLGQFAKLLLRLFSLGRKALNGSTR